MNAIEVLEHFLSQADWVDRGDTVDRIIMGDPHRQVRRAMVTWISSLQAVTEAVEGGFDLLITHEPTFYDHYDHRADQARIEESEVAARKKRLIEEVGLVIVRIHDVWDRFPLVGIPWAWAAFLGLGDQPAATDRTRYQHRYDIKPITVDALAARLAAKIATIGESHVQVVSDGRQKVSRIGIGTGCVCNIDVFREMGCDLSVVCDDGSCYWREIQRAADAGHPVIRVNHGTAEEPGMVTLARYVNDHLPGLEAVHLRHGSCFRLVGAS
jgi:putative NIF3 family GTP cyclohydrolase 1 type 2